MNEKKILVIGFGSIGRRHVNNILQISNYKIIVITSRNNIKKEEIFNYKKNFSRIKFTDELQKSLQETYLAGFITNETNLHLKSAITLAKKNINLFIEKPLSNSVKNISILESIVKKNKIKVMIGCNFRFYPPIIKIKKLIDSNFLGNIISVQCENNSFLPDWHPDEDYTQSYASRLEKGGGVTLTQIHELDYLIWFFGKIKNNFSISGKYSNLNINVDDLSTNLIQFKKNILVELHLDFFSRPFFKQIKIKSNKGTILWNSEKNRIKFFNHKKEKWENIPIENNYSLYSKKINQMYLDELKYFFNCIEKNMVPMNNLAESKYTLKNALNMIK